MTKRLLAIFLSGMIALTMIAQPVFAQNGNEQDAPDPGTPPKGVAVKTFIHYDKKPSQSGLVIAGATNETYSYSGYHWADPNGSDNQGIKYYVNLNYSARKSPGLNRTAAKNAIDASFSTWVNAQDAGPNPLLYQDSGSTTASGGKYDRKNVISWKALRGGTIAVTYVWYNTTTGEILEFDMLINNNYAWSVTSPDMTGILYDPNGPADDGTDGTYGDPINAGLSNPFDIQNIITHEAGHTLMLDDLYESGAESLTMFGYSSYGELSKDTLQRGDYLGLNYIY